MLLYAYVSRNIISLNNKFSVHLDNHPSLAARSLPTSIILITSLIIIKQRRSMFFMTKSAPILSNAASDCSPVIAHSNKSAPSYLFVSIDYAQIPVALFPAISKRGQLILAQKKNTGIQSPINFKATRPSNFTPKSKYKNP